MKPRYLVLASRLARVFGLRQNERGNQPIQSQVTGKDLNENGSNKEGISLAIDLSTGVSRETHFLPGRRHGRLGTDCSRTGVGGNANGQAGCQGTQADAQAGGQMRKGIVLRVGDVSRGVGLAKFAIQNDGDNETVNAQDTGHDHRNNILH